MTVQAMALNKNYHIIVYFLFGRNFTNSWEHVIDLDYSKIIKELV